MILKSFALVLIGLAAASAVCAQPTSARSEARVFAFPFDGGYLGVETAEVTKENFAKFGLREVRGVAIEKVTDGSPAQAAGLQHGDVIVKFNGDEITSVRKLMRLIGEVAADHQAKLSILRNGDEREVEVTLAKRPMPVFDGGAFPMAVPAPRDRIPFPPITTIPHLPNIEPMPPIRALPPIGDDENFTFFRGGRQIGLSVTPLTKQLAEHFNVSSGVLIANVRENSPAAKAGLRAGDIIVEVDGKEAKTDIDLIRAIGEKKDGDIQLTVVRSGNRQTFRVTPEEVKSSFRTFEAPDGAIIAPGGTRLAIPAQPPLLIPGRVL